MPFQGVSGWTDAQWSVVPKVLCVEAAGVQVGGRASVSVSQVP